jgi:predicted short-subunit dehydrogenase-like oxidoreductase (DUF2520 family)
MVKKVSILGAGNVGTHLIKRFQNSGVVIHQVFTRHIERNSDWEGINITDKIEELDNTADVYICSIHDAGIEDLGKKLAQIVGNQLIVHTSGTIPSTVLAHSTERYGVFYPLQSFSKKREPDWNEIPICIDANTLEDKKLLHEIALHASPKVYHISDEQRAKIHVAAVFVNNFVNHLYHIGEEILLHEQLPFDILKPLIRETAAKIEHLPPSAMQTGPARRGDQLTIDRHLSYLSQFSDFQEIYARITKDIIKWNKQTKP